MKWIEDKKGRDNWKYDNEEIASLEERDSDELKSITQVIDEVIKNQEESMQRRFPGSLNYFLRGGELYTYKRTPGGQQTTEEIKVELKHLVHKRFTPKSKSIEGIIYPESIPYTEDEINKDIKGGIKWLEHKRVRRKMLDIAFLRRNLGEEYFEISKLGDDEDNYDELRELVHGELKKRTAEIYEELLNNGDVKQSVKETIKVDKNNFDYTDENIKERYPILSKVVACFIEKDRIELKTKNISTISDYLRQGYYRVKKVEGKYTVTVI